MLRIYSISQKLKLILTLVATLLLLGQCNVSKSDKEQTSKDTSTKDQKLQTRSESTSKSTFDEQYAKQLGADDYGMKTYVMAFLKAGPNRDQDSLTAAKIQKAHQANIRRLAKEGKLVLAGPFMEEGEWQGIYIFREDVANSLPV